MAADPVRVAIFARLHGDATLKGLLSGPDEIHEDLAPQGTAPPYVVFAHHAGPRQMVFGPGREIPVWLIKGICSGESSTRAEEIDERCGVLLDRTRLAVPGGTLTILRESSIRLSEDSAGEHWRHRGAYYRVFT